ASNDVREEYVEVFNRGELPCDLNGWRLSGGVDFTFPSITIEPGEYRVVAADPGVFAARHPEVTGVLGGWTGQLSDNGEEIRLRDATGALVNSVTYATEGDWGVRVRGPNDLGHRGWIWSVPHDGGGSSLELIGTHRSNDVGQNWAASLVAGGTPGTANSVALGNGPPFIAQVEHRPAVPGSSDPVWITAQVTDENFIGVSVVLHWRVDRAPEFQSLPMADDGQHGDGRPFDQVFGAVLPAQPQSTIVEFYVEARDAGGLVRTWPAAVQPDGEQIANCLYQVDNTGYEGTLPLFRTVLTGAELAEVEENDARGWSVSSDALFNATFISQEAGEFEVRYQTGFRIRGTTSRENAVKNRRVSFSNDRPWHGLRAINVNASFPQSQQLAAAVFRLAGLGAPTARAVRLRENNADRTGGGVYVEAEVINSDFARRQFPLDSNGNVYRSNSDLSYLGDDPAFYRDNRLYVKHTNTSADDWSDLIDLLQALNETPDDQYVSEVYRVWDVPAWIRFFALNTLLSNQETSLGMGKAGDFAMYRGVNDPRFVPVPYDSDSYCGVVGGLESPIWRATRLATVERFLTHPEFAPLYHAEMWRLMGDLLDGGRLDPLIDQLLGPWMDVAGRRQIKDFMAARLAFVKASLPAPALKVTATLPWNAYSYTPTPTTSLVGSADPVLTRAVFANGVAADWDPVLGTWSIPQLPLQPGVNWIFVQAVDDAGREVASKSWSIWRNDQAGHTHLGEVNADTVWAAAEGPHVISGQLVVRPGATLTIQPGSSVFFNGAASLWVEGRLLAEGLATNPICFARSPGTYGFWPSITLQNATNENRLSHATFEYSENQTLLVTNSVLVLEDCTWGAIIGSAIKVRNGSLVARRCRFPNTQWSEVVAGVGTLPGGRFLIEDCRFGVTTGYTDIIDITDTNETSGPVIIRNNVFTGGGDDGVDLDGTAALVEGNFFRNFHKDNTSASESSAIAGGEYAGYPARLTVVRNVFENNDFGMMLKERAEAWIEHNTFLGHT
ncbi:MAG: CotH kinase family protein, partial [Verrucomicrobiae bacterium]|nr:CotH kinase family protein [Verrucomicrobiae bacterium]